MSVASVMSIASLVSGLSRIFVISVSLALLVTWIWMLVHCVTNKDLLRPQKLFWFIVILLGNWIGALVYAYMRPPGQRPWAPLLVMTPCAVILGLMFMNVVPLGIEAPSREEAIQARSDAVMVVEQAEETLGPGAIKSAQVKLESGDAAFKQSLYKQAATDFRHAKDAAEWFMTKTEEARGAQVAAQSALAAVSAAREKWWNESNFYTSPNLVRGTRIQPWEHDWHFALIDASQRTDDILGLETAAAEGAFEVAKSHLAENRPQEAIASFARARELAEKIALVTEEIRKTSLSRHKVIKTWNSPRSRTLDGKHPHFPENFRVADDQFGAGQFRDARATYLAAQGRLATGGISTIGGLQSVKLRSQPTTFFETGNLGDRAPAKLIEEVRGQGLSLPAADVKNPVLHIRNGWVVRFDVMVGEAGYTGVGDFATGLIWLEPAEVSGSLVKVEDIESAITLCNSKKPYGYSGWRLPTGAELISLMDNTHDDRGSYLPPMFQRGIFWSSDKFRADRPQSEFEQMKVEYDAGTAAVIGTAVSHPSGGAYLRLVRSWPEDEPGWTKKIWSADEIEERLHVEKGKLTPSTAVLKEADRALAGAEKARAWRDQGTAGSPRILTFEPDSERTRAWEIWRWTNAMTDADNAAAKASIEDGKRYLALKQLNEAKGSFDRARELAARVVRAAEEIPKALAAFHQEKLTFWREVHAANGAPVVRPFAYSTAAMQFLDGSYRDARHSFFIAEGQEVATLQAVALRSEGEQYAEAGNLGNHPPARLIEQLRDRDLKLPSAKLAGADLHAKGSLVRYEVFPDEAGHKGVGDFATGLLWLEAPNSERAPVKQDDIPAALSMWNSSKPYGYGDWRLPTAEELASLMEISHDNRGAYLPPMFLPGSYWSADTFKPDRPEAGPARIAVDYHTGEIVAGGSNRHPAYLRLVRTWSSP
jgi:hypothetical protein